MMLEKYFSTTKRFWSTHKAILALNLQKVIHFEYLRLKLPFLFPRELKGVNRHLSISFMAALLIGTGVAFPTDSSNASLASLFPPTPSVTNSIIGDISIYTPSIKEDPKLVSAALTDSGSTYFEQLTSLGISDNSSTGGTQIGEIGELRTVKAGDSIAKIAADVGLRPESIMVANNIDAKKIKTDPKALQLHEGQQIIIPYENLDSGDNLMQIALDAESARKQAVAQLKNTSTSKNKKVAKGKNGKSFLLSSTSGRDYGSYEGFTSGWCTAWAAKNRPDIARTVRSEGGGNAGRWDDQARKAGLQVDRNPEVGAVLVTNESRYGHVSIIKAVNGDGSVVVSEMNGPAGRGAVDERSISASMISNVIH